MILAIIGRTGTGKTRLSYLLEQRGLAVAKTHSTRPPRSVDDDSHYFISKEEADAFDPNQKAAVTVINGHEYFTSKAELARCDVIVIDPSGITDLSKRNPDLTIHAVYMFADDFERKLNAIKRADDKIKEEMVFDARDESEDEQFSAFEDVLREDRLADTYPHITCMMQYSNHFNEKDMDDYADFLAFHVRQHNRLAHIVEEWMNCDILRKDETTGNPIIVLEDGKQVAISCDMFADLIANDDDTPIGLMMRNYIAVSPRFTDLDAKPNNG